MNITTWILIYWTVASIFAFLILRLDYPTFKAYPLVSTGILTYLGPFGWLLFILHSSRFIKDSFNNRIKGV